MFLGKYLIKYKQIYGIGLKKEISDTETWFPFIVISL